jgi:hypothetical protein
MTKLKKGRVGGLLSSALAHTFVVKLRNDWKVIRPHKSEDALLRARDCAMNNVVDV